MRMRLLWYLGLKPQCALQTTRTIKAIQQAYWLGLSHIYTARPGTDWVQPLTWFVGIKVHATSFAAHAHMTTHAAVLQKLKAFKNFPNCIMVAIWQANNAGKAKAKVIQSKNIHCLLWVCECGRFDGAKA